MKVLLTSGIYAPDIGGPASYIPKIADALAKRGHEVTVVAVSSGTPGTTRESFGTLVRIERGTGALSRKARTVRALLPHLMSTDLLYANGLFEELRPLLPLVRVPAIAKYVGDWGWERARSKGLYADTIDAFQDAPLGGRAALVRKGRTVSARGFRRVIVPSRYLAQMVSRWYPTPPDVTVIYNGITIPPDLTVPPKDPETFQICTVCRLVPWKHVDELIGFLRHLPGARLKVVGDGEERGNLEAHALACGVRDRVDFKGSLPRKDALAELGSSDLFVLNSDYEGLPHVVLEAMALGVPVVARHSGGSAEVLGDGTFGALGADGAAVLEAIQALRTDPQGRHAMAERARQVYHERYTETAMLAQTVTRLEAAAQGR